MKKSTTDQQLRSALGAALGALGRGKSKRRGNAAYYRDLAAKRTNPGRKAKNSNSQTS